MPELSPIDPRSAALLVMDCQVDVLTRFMTPAQSADAIAPGEGDDCRSRQEAEQGEPAHGARGHRLPGAS
jgi:hypothetical protein